MGAQLKQPKVGLGVEMEENGPNNFKVPRQVLPLCYNGLVPYQNVHMDDGNALMAKNFAFHGFYSHLGVI